MHEPATPETEGKVTVEEVLRHFETEANAADELILASDMRSMCSRYDIPHVRRYEVERDTYRYVLEKLRAALDVGPQDSQGFDLDVKSATWGDGARLQRVRVKVTDSESPDDQVVLARETDDEAFTLQEIRGRVTSREALSAAGIDYDAANDLLDAAFPPFEDEDESPATTPGDSSEEGADDWEPRAGQPHPIDKAFYDLTVKERNYERVRFDRVEKERDSRLTKAEVREKLTEAAKEREANREQISAQVIREVRDDAFPEEGS